MKRLTKKSRNGYYSYNCTEHEQEDCVLYENCGECYGSTVLNRLGKIEDKIESGLMWELPCKIGDKIYVIPSKANYDLNSLMKHPENNRVHTQVVCEVRFFKDKTYLLTTCEGQWQVHSAFFMDNWFLSYEEAEQRLKEFEEDE